MALVIVTVKALATKTSSPVDIVASHARGKKNPNPKPQTLNPKP